MALQAVVMWNAPFVPALGPLFNAYAQIPLAVTAALGIAAGAAAGWFGWQAGGAAKKRAPATA